MLKNTSLIISIICLVVVVVTIATGPWLLNIIGKVFNFLGDALITIGKFLDFFGIGG